MRRRWVLINCLEKRNLRKVPNTTYTPKGRKRLYLGDGVPERVNADITPEKDNVQLRVVYLYRSFIVPATNLQLFFNCIRLGRFLIGKSIKSYSVTT